MSGISGADPEELDRLGEAFLRVRDAVIRSKGDIDRMAKAIGWKGPAAARFAAEWQGGASTALNNAVDDLWHVSRLVRDQANEQRRASDASGGRSGRAPHVDLRDPERRRGHEGGDLTYWSWTFPFLHYNGFRSDTNLRYIDPNTVDVGPVDVDDVVQGAVGDCYFAAAIAAIAATEGGPERLRDMVTKNADGTFTVRFADGTTQRVDADMYVNSNGIAYGHGRNGEENLYSIIEKAYAQRHGGYDDLDAGGQSANVFREFGFSGQVHDVGHSTSPDAVWRDLENARTGGRPATVSIEGPHFAGLPAGHGHSLSVVNAYRGADGEEMVRLRNPWGSNPTNNHGGSENWRDAFEHAGASFAGTEDDGTFEMSAKDLTAMILNYQTG